MKTSGGARSRGSKGGKIPRQGFDLYYHAYGGGEPILVLAGGPGLDCDYMKPVARKLAATHWSVLPELRGTGRSLPPEMSASTISLKQYLTDLEALRETFELRRWIVLGHSAGAIMALNYAIACPARVQALVLMDSMPVRQSLTGSMFDTIFMRLTPKQAGVARRHLTLRGVLPGYFYGREAAVRMIAAFRDESFHGDVYQLLSNDTMGPGVDLRPALRRLPTPALIVAGRQDQCDPGMQYEIYLALKNSRLEILERCGHFAWLEQPRALYAALRQFLEKLQTDAQ